MSKVKKNLVFQGFYQILNIILPLITAPYVSRVLGADNIGIYAYTYAVANYFVLFAMLGINNYGNTLIASLKKDKHKADEGFCNLFALHLTISFAVLIIYVLYVTITSTETPYLLICVFYLLGAAFDINWAFFGLEEFKVTITRNTIVRLITIASIFTFVKSPNDLWKYILIMSLGTCVSQSIIWIVIPKYFSYTKPTWMKMRLHIKPLLELFIPVIAISLYKVMDKIMIKHLANTTQLGLYENAEKIINIPMGIITAVGMVMLPRAASMLSENDVKGVKRGISVTIKYVMIIAYALTFGLAAIATDFAPFFFGKEFIGSGVMIMGLSATIPFLAFANIIRTQYLIPKAYNKIYIISVFCGAAVNLVANYLLIPHLLGNGAVIGTILAEITVCVIQSASVNKELSQSKDLLESSPYLLIGVVMFIMVKLFGSIIPEGLWRISIEIICGALIYCILSVLVLLKRKDALVFDVLMRTKVSRK